ncbi:hypothetical protein HD806DRAFT_494753 [Xylariaceae sp. AK1471]|nr:hypothetical protein HD806DRAFT_494753 [Xylariaceae sp. AK1471]
MDLGPKRVEKRNRPPVSCEPCRTRKLKCNRSLPCESCIRRNKVSLCHYSANATRSDPGPSKQRELKDRLNTLESLVSSFLSGDTVIQPASHSTRRVDAEHGGTISPAAKQGNEPIQLDSVSSSHGKAEDALTPETPHLQETGDGQVNYIDPSHWQSILEDIKEVREHLTTSTQPLRQSDLGGDSDRVLADASYLFGTVPSAPFREILSSLPPQPICDKLVSWYFGMQIYVSGIVHPAKFQNEYEAFWESPSTAPPLWTALLFSILSVIVSVHQLKNRAEPDSSIPPVHILQKRAVQCLVLGKYATANAHALEAFVLHLLSCLLSNDDPATNMWFEMGTIIRLAFRMGYHRDPDNLPGISTFDGEMRRRLWLNIVQIEALMSYQIGFPSMIPSEFCDTKVPRNLENSDLHMDMTTLPPARPLSENTTVRYAVAKHTVMSVFKEIVSHTQSLAIPAHDAYNRTTALHNKMNEAYNGLPQVLKRRDINRSFLDPSGLILERCTIETVYLKALIILHRRYISYDRQSQKSEPSRRACIEAALDILARQADLHKACQPGGRLYEDRWMIFTLPVHDFLLAAMVICLDLSVCMRSRGAIDESIDYQQLRGREYRALQTSREIWAAESSSLPDAHVASLALDLMIRKVAEDNNNILPNHTVAHGDMPPAYDSGFQYAGAMSQMIDGSEIVDWALLDQYLQHLDGSNADAFF